MKQKEARAAEELKEQEEREKERLAQLAEQEKLQMKIKSAKPVTKSNAEIIMEMREMEK